MTWFKLQKFLSDIVITIYEYDLVYSIPSPSQGFCSFSTWTLVIKVAAGYCGKNQGFHGIAVLKKVIKLTWL